MKQTTRLLTPAETLHQALRPACRDQHRQQQRRFLYQGGRPFTPYEARQQGPPPPPRERQDLPDAARSSPQQAQLIPGLQKKLAGYTLNRNIVSRWVQIRQPDGKLAAPTMLETLLQTINPSSQVIRQLAAQGPTPETAIVEIQSIEELLKLAAKRDQAVKEVEKQRKDQKAKTLEMNWAISENDLGLKLKQLEQFLEKGRKVEILLAAKKRQRKASEEEAQAVVKKLREKVEEVGAKELKMEGKLLGQAMLMVQKK